MVFLKICISLIKRQIIYHFHMFCIIKFPMILFPLFLLFVSIMNKDEVLHRGFRKRNLIKWMRWNWIYGYGTDIKK